VPHPHPAAGCVSHFHSFVDTPWYADLDSLLADPKFQEQSVSVCSSCSLNISDKKLVSFSTGEAPIPGNSLRSLGYGTSCPVPDLFSKSPVVTARTQSHQMEKVDGTPRAEVQSIAKEQRHIAQMHSKTIAAIVSKNENFAFVCAWKEVPEIQRLFAVCAASAVGGFQVCCSLSCAMLLTQSPQTQFQPLRLRDAEVTMEQWMLMCRECNFGFHLNLSNSELRQSFCDARCGIQENSQLTQHMMPRIALDLPQFAQSLVFVVFSQAPAQHKNQSHLVMPQAARAGMIFPFDWKVFAASHSHAYFSTLVSAATARQVVQPRCMCRFEVYVGCMHRNSCVCQQRQTVIRGPPCQNRP
jgi:hypothetical protein